MRKYLIAIACLFAFPAMAADNFKATSYIPAPNWTGSWLGIQGIYAPKGSIDNPFVGFDTDGWAGGFNLGTQTQYGNWVWGLEAEANYGRIIGNTNLGPVAIQHNTEALGSLRMRLGYASGAYHIYGLGGFAMASTSASISAGPFSATDSKTHYGYVVGAGAEYMLSRQWVTGVEYSYYAFSGENYGFALAGPIGLVTPVDFDIHTIKGKIAYRW